MQRIYYQVVTNDNIKLMKSTQNTRIFILMFVGILLTLLLPVVLPEVIAASDGMRTAKVLSSRSITNVHKGIPIAQMIAEGSSARSETGNTCHNPILMHALKLGATDARTAGEVSMLQQFLAKDSSVYPEGWITGYFGERTEAAVRRFQAKQSIVSSGTPSTTGFGLVGPRTRRAIAECPVTMGQTSPRGDGPVHWADLIPDVRAVLNASDLPEVQIELSKPLSILQEADITEDGVPEAIVALGDGGASNERVTLVRIEGGKPVVARFKRDGRAASVLSFTHGASIPMGSATGMLPEKNAFFSVSWSRSYDPRMHEVKISCDAEAYHWDDAEKVFVLVIELGKFLKTKLCKKADVWPGSGVFDLE